MCCSTADQLSMTRALSSDSKGGGFTFNFSSSFSASILVAAHELLFVDVASGFAVSALDVSKPLPLEKNDQGSML
jgi:hypothetical protein